MALTYYFLQLMFTVLILLIISAIAGYLLRNFTSLQKVLNRSTTITIVLLLFIFGMSIGSNESILSNLHKDGAKAGVIAVLGILGSVAATACFRLMNKKGGAK